MNTQRYTVNVRVGGIGSPRVAVSQGDIGRHLVFNLFDGAVAFAMTSGTTATIVGRKPSGLGFTETCTLDGGNSVSVRTTEAMTQEAGKIPAELRISDGTKVIGTANFVFYVEPSPHPDGTTDGTLETMDDIQTQIGDLSDLTTSDKSSLVGAINEAAQSGGSEVVIDATLTQSGQAADAKATGDALAEIKADLGDLSDLETTDKSSVVAAINEAVQSGGEHFTTVTETIQLSPGEEQEPTPTEVTNLIDPDDPDLELNKYITKQGAIATSSSGKGAVSGYIPVTTGVWYVYHYLSTLTPVENAIRLYDASKAYIDYWNPAVTHERIRYDTDGNGYKYVAFKLSDISSARYVRVSLTKAEIGVSAMFLQCDTMPDTYIPYGESSVGGDVEPVDPSVYTVVRPAIESAVADLGAKRIRLEMEPGTFGAVGNPTSAFSPLPSTRRRTAFYIKTNGASSFSLLDLGLYEFTSIYLDLYDETMSYIGASNAITSPVNISIQSNVKYIKFVVLTEEKIRTLDAAFYGGIYPPEQVKNNYNAASANESAQMLFDITEETYGCARIMLPSTYSVDGAPVPLILYAHGSGMMTQWNQEMARYAYHKFFCDEGFAVLEIFGQDNKDWVTYGQGPAGVDPYSLQYWIKMYEKAVKKACHIYNLDWDNIHMVCKSQGGHLAYHYVSCPPTFHIRSVSMFAPVLDYLSMRGGTDSAADSRRMLAREAGFEGDIETEFIGKNTYSEICSAFLLANIEKVNGLNEAWRGLVGQTLAEKFTTSMDNGSKWWQDKTRTDIYQDTDLCKIGFIPTKIWAATNDASTPYQKSVEAVAQLNNGGTEAHMRLFDTGGHAINTSSGPQTTNVTAANGTVWSTVPTCVYEASQWMKSKMPHGSI